MGTLRGNKYFMKTEKNKKIKTCRGRHSGVCVTNRERERGRTERDVFMQRRTSLTEWGWKSCVIAEERTHGPTRARALHPHPDRKRHPELNNSSGASSNKCECDQSEGRDSSVFVTFYFHHKPKELRTEPRRSWTQLYLWTHTHTHIDCVTFWKPEDKAGVFLLKKVTQRPVLRVPCPGLHS